MRQNPLPLPSLPKQILPSLDQETFCLRPDIPPGGRLSQFLPFWREITQDQWILSVIEKGYHLELIRTPPITGLRRTRLRDGSEFLCEEVAELCAKYAVEPVPPGQVGQGFYSTYFVVPKKDGGLRPILNLKAFNHYMQVQKFKMETMHSIIAIMQPGLWLASVDLKDAYFHVPIAGEHRKYLRFHINGKSYQYRVTPFGLSLAPRLFTKILLVLIKWLRLRGIRLHAYLDDILILGDSPQEVQDALMITINVLTQAGFIINVKKSDLLPTQDLVYIGGRFRTDLGRIFLPEDRRKSLIRAVNAFKRVGQRHSARLWLQILGLMAATISSVDLANLNMRPIQWYLKSQWRLRDDSLEAKVMVPKSLLPCLNWWSDPRNLSAGKPFQDPPCTLTVTTDASMEGWGGHSCINGEELLFCGLWSREECRFHINFLELRAIRLTLSKLGMHVENHRVRIECDNTSAVAWINHQGGTHSWALWQETQSLFQWMSLHNVTLEAVHRPGVDNVLADFLSRNRPDPTEWSLSNRACNKLFRLWGKPQIDLFASLGNHKLPLWFSRNLCLEATAADAFSQTWTGWRVYAFPPFNLIQRTLLKIRDEGVEEALVVVPHWPSRPWFTLLLQMAKTRPRRFELEITLLTQKLPGKGTLYHPDLETVKLVAWRLNGKLGNRQASVKQLSTLPWQPNEHPPDLSMTADGAVLCLGVNDVTWTQLQHL